MKTLKRKKNFPSLGNVCSVWFSSKIFAVVLWEGIGINTYPVTVKKKKIKKKNRKKKKKCSAPCLFALLRLTAWQWQVHKSIHWDPKKSVMLISSINCSWTTQTNIKISINYSKETETKCTLNNYWINNTFFQLWTIWDRSKP